VLIPIVAIGGFFAWMISLSPMARAMAERMRKLPVSDTDREELRDGLEQIRREVAELAERVDFTERLLAKQQEAARLERPR